MINDLEQFVARLEASIVYRDSFAGRSYVDPTAISMVVSDARALAAAVRASLREEERPAPGEKVEAESYRQALSLIFDELGLERGRRTRPDATLRIKALKRAASPAPSEGLEEMPATIYPETIFSQDTITNARMAYRLVHSPHKQGGNERAFQEGDMVVRWERGRWQEWFLHDGYWPSADFLDGLIRADCALYRPVPPPQEPPAPTPQHVYDSILTRLDALGPEWKTLRSLVMDDVAMLNVMAYRAASAPVEEGR